jgi:thiol:disulfide interchange protein DsbD
MGALSLLTPCVFPMIPVTVSYFTKHASGSRGGAVRLATIYALGIILTFTVLGVALAVLAGAAGLNRFAANPWVNIAIAALFIVCDEPVWFVGASRRRSPTGQRVGACRPPAGALMGGVFTSLVHRSSARCVLAAQGERTWPVTGMLSSVFALPFFVLALAPQLVSQLPKAGGWMTSVKVVMGFLEIAAAMKFLSNADLVWGWQVLTRDVVLAVWVGIGVLVAAYVLGMFRVEDDAPVERVSGWRLAFAIVTLGVTVWLFAGIFGRSLGELESFLPPALEREQGTSSSGGLSTGGPSLSWITNDRARAFDDAKASNRLVFVDFTGYTCTNCRWMEANMFTKPRCAKYRAPQAAPTATANPTTRNAPGSSFQTVALLRHPPPDGSTVATFAGLTRNREDSSPSSNCNKRSLTRSCPVAPG